MPNNDSQDILIVQNVDLSCNDIDSEEGWSHADFFQVKWGGQPHRIAPGETRRMPRYVAEHYAKHLADHMLQKMEVETGRQFLVNGAIERPNMLKRIIMGVDEYFLQQTAQTGVSEGEKVAQEVDRMNPEEKETDLGVIPDPMVGVLKEEPKAVPIEDDNSLKEKSSLFDAKKDKPSRGAMIKECANLGIDWSMKNTNAELEAKLKAF